jgi:hypothetical protein
LRKEGVPLLDKLPLRREIHAKKEVRIEVYVNRVVMGRGSRERPGNKLFTFEKEG